jgi:hypothetical protein
VARGRPRPRGVVLRGSRAPVGEQRTAAFGVAGGDAVGAEPGGFVAALEPPLEVPVNPGPGAYQRGGAAGGDNRRHQRRATTGQMLIETLLDVLAGGPAEVVACHAATRDRQAGLQMQQVHGPDHVRALGRNGGGCPAPDRLTFHGMPVPVPARSGGS